MKPCTLFWLMILVVLLGSCSMMPQTRCHAATATATQTWEVEYYISKTSGGLKDRRIQAFQSNTTVNLNGEKPAEAVSGPDDEGVWWGEIPPRPTADEVDRGRDLQEFDDPPQLQRTVQYELECDRGVLSTDARSYREAARAIWVGNTVTVRYLWHWVTRIEARDAQ